MSQAKRNIEDLAKSATEEEIIKRKKNLLCMKGKVDIRICLLVMTFQQ